MLFDDFCQKLKDTGFHVAEADNKKPVHRPYILCLKGVDSSLYADGIPVIEKCEAVVELYTDRTDISSCPKLERWFRDNCYNRYEIKDRVFITEPNCYVTEYRVILI